MKGFNPLASVVAAIKELTTEVRQFIKEQREFNKRIEAKVDFLVAEVSRYKNDSDELLVSVYAYCMQERVKFSYNDLFYYGGAATRLSRQLGAKIEKTNDPRFGQVNLYERYILDNVVLEQGDK